MANEHEDMDLDHDSEGNSSEEESEIPEESNSENFTGEEASERETEGEENDDDEDDDDGDDDEEEENDENIEDLYDTLTEESFARISTEDMQRALASAITLWTPPSENEIIVWAKHRFGFEEDQEIITSTLEASYSIHMIKIFEFIKQMQNKGMYEQMDQDTLITSGHYAEIVCTAIQYAYWTLSSASHTFKCLTDHLNFVPSHEMAGMMVQLLDPEKFLPLQKLLLYVLQNLKENGYQRLGDDIWEQIEHNGYKTRAWKKKDSIKNYIYKITATHRSPLQWTHMNTKGTPGFIIECITNCQEKYFKDLELNQRYMSFNNCIWDLNNFKAYPYTGRIPDGIVSCKFHNVEFPIELLNVKNYRDIKTPLFDSIFENQKFGFVRNHLGVEVETPETAKILRIIYVLLGRLLYPIGWLDGWQLIPTVIGRAETGKSTLASIIQSFYPDEKIGILSSEIESVFGLENLVNRDVFIYMCLELKKTSNLPQAQIQSMATGEMLTVQRKFKVAITLLWKACGIFFGNSQKNWGDEEMNMARRIVEIFFYRKVDVIDTSLLSKIRTQELPFILLKITIAYREFAALHGGKSFWRIPSTDLPDYFTLNKKMFTRRYNMLVSFINGESMDLKPHRYITVEEFSNAYNDFLVRSGNRKIKFDAEIHESVFDDHSIIHKSDTKLWNGAPVTKHFLFGIGFRLDNPPDCGVPTNSTGQ